MKNTKLKRSISAVALMGMAWMPLSSMAQTVLFSDNFQTNSASAWSVFGVGTRSNAIVMNEHVINFSTNYTQIQYQSGLTIPPAPRSSDGTNSRGLYMTCNHKVFTAGTTANAANAAIAMVQAYPLGQNFTGNYSLRFDMFQTYNGGRGGGSGSTEMAMFGVNHSGTKTNWYSGHPSFVPANWASDGQWFWVDGEGGTGGATPAAGSTTGVNHADMEAFVGNDTTASSALGSGGGFFFPQGVDYTGADTNSASPVMSHILPVPPGESWGAPGKQWVQMEVRSQGGFVTWLMNGFVIASHNDLRGFVNGTTMLGYTDPVRGTPPTNEWRYCFVVYDNVQVVSLGTNEMTPTVTIAATQPNASKPDAGPAVNGVFTISRQDRNASPVSPNTPLTVKLIISGTASNGVDYALISTNVVIPAGASSANLNIVPTSLIGNPTMTVNARIAGSFDYELNALYPYNDTVTITDSRGVPAVTVETTKAIAYGKYRPGEFNLVAAASYTTNVTVNFTLTGTATNGVDYVSVPLSATLPAGNTNILVSISPTSNTLNTNRTAILTVANGNGYRVGAISNGTVTLRTPALSAPSAVAFSDQLDSDTSANWNINKSLEADPVTFGYDYSVDGIPPAPASGGSSTIGVKMQANNSGGTRAGLSISPKGLNLTGDYRLRFDFWLNFYGGSTTGISDNAGPTMWFGGGVGTTGLRTNWDNGAADGIWIDFNNDGSSTVSTDLEAFRGSADALDATWFANSQSHFDTYYSEFGRESAPSIQDQSVQFGLSGQGIFAFRWHDFLAVKQGTNVTFYIDNLPITRITTNGITLSTNIFITYYSEGTATPLYSDLLFALIDNVRVENLTVTPPTTPSITSVQVVGANVQINFTGGTSDTATAFTLEGKALVNGAFGTEPGSGVVQLSPGSFRATAPLNGATRFYRIKR